MKGTTEDAKWLRGVAYTLLGVLWSANVWAIKDYLNHKVEAATATATQKAKDKEQDAATESVKETLKRHERILCAVAVKLKVAVVECDAPWVIQ